MIKYSWIQFMQAGGSCKGALNLFNQVVTKRYKSIKKLKLALREVDVYGFILLEKEFMECPATDSDKCMYLKLAALRNYYDYLQHGQEKLPVYLFTGDLVKLRRNPLLTIDDNYIYFKY